MNNKLRFAFLLIGTFLFLGSCNPRINKQIIKDEIVIFPTPPDTARIQFLTAISNSQQITGKRSRFAEFILGEIQATQIHKPYGITIRDNKLYICDPGIGGLEIIDLEKNEFTYFVPSGLGLLRLPLKCAVDEDGFLYVADPERGQVVVFDKEGNYINAFGEGEDFKPLDIFIQDDKIWVANFRNGKINVHSRDSTYKLLFKFPEDGVSENGKLFAPTSVIVSDEHVYVCDVGDYAIKKYSLDGKFISSVGSHGIGIGQFARPKGIAVDRESTLFVVDAMFENVQMFNNDGKLLMFFGGHYNGPGGLWLPTTIIIDYDNLEYFQKYVNPAFILKYLILVTSQYGPDKINIYGAVKPNK